MLRQGFHVVGLSRKSPGALVDLGVGWATSSIDWVSVDLCDSEAVRCTVDTWRPDAVVHLAASAVRAESEDPSSAFSVNATAAFEFGRVCARAGVRRFVHVGSGFEYAEAASAIDESAPLAPANLYGLTKAAGWLGLNFLARTAGLALVTLRPFSLYGPWEGDSKLVPFVMRRALRGMNLPLTAGEQVRDYMFVSDLADAIAASLESEEAVGQVFNLGAGPDGALSVREFVVRILDVVGAPRSLARFGDVGMKRPEPKRLIANTEKAQRALGWEPRVSLGIGLRAVADWIVAGASGTME